jgi:hypothetical protein
MQHVRIAKYDIKSGSFDELAEQARVGMLPTFQEEPGFIRYGLADLGEGKCVSISLWESRKDADSAVPVASAWDRDNLGDRVELKETLIGGLVFFEGTPAKV